MSLVREDEKGLYIILNGQKRRPGSVAGMDHVYDMSDGGLKAGDKVEAHHISQSDHIKIKLDNGRELVWSGEWTLGTFGEYQNQTREK